MQYSLPYLILLIFFGICAVLYELSQDDTRKQYITYSVLGVFIVFFAFRGYINTDWRSYADFFDKVAWDDIFEIYSEKSKSVVHEPGFTLLCLLCKSIINEYSFLVFIITIIDVLLLYRFTKRWNIHNVAFVLLLFVTFRGTSMMFNLMRNQIAIFIFMNAIEYIRDRKILPYYLLCTLALCFHLSSIFFFPLYFILHLKLNRWVYGGLFLSFFVFFISHASLLMIILNVLGLEGALGGKAEFYTEMFSKKLEFSPTGTIEKFGLVTLLVIYYDEIINKFKGRQIILNCLLLYMLFYYVFSDFYELSVRMCTLFVFAYWVLWIDIFQILVIPNNKKLYIALLFLYCGYVTALAYPLAIQEYDNLLFGGKSQSERIRILNKNQYEDN